MIRQLVRFVTLLTAVALIGSLGCGHCGSARVSFRFPTPPCCGDRTAAYAPVPVIVGSPSAPLPAPPNGLPPSAPPAVGPWQPGPNGVQPYVVETRPLPVPASPRLPDSSGSSGSPSAPSSPRQNGTKLLPPQDDAVKPAVADKPQGDTGDFPPDIPQFNLVYDQVGAGLRPFPGGFEWLKSRGYKRVLNLRTPGEDDSADRTEVERMGMKYLALEVGPRTLNAELVKQFSKVVQDKDGYPLFVYDRKGVTAGALWYLHFRLADNMPEAQARAKAMRLGLKEETTGEHADLWLAINQILRGI